MLVYIKHFFAKALYHQVTSEAKVVLSIWFSGITSGGNIQDSGNVSTYWQRIMTVTYPFHIWISKDL